MRRHWLSVGLLAALIIGIGLAQPKFFSHESLESVLLWMPILLVAALGQLLVIVIGGIDVSIGSIVGCAGIAVGLVTRSNPSLPIALYLGIGLLVGILLGFLNGVAVSVAKIQPLVVTIGTLAAFRGIAFLLSKGDQIDSSMIPDSMTSLAHRGIPLGSLTLNWLFLMALLLSLVFAFGLRKTQAGRNVFLLGSNAHAAILRGLSRTRIQLCVYTLCGATAGIGGFLYASRFGFVNPGSAGQNLELTVIAAVAIGGVKLTGGAGTVFGTFMGCLLLSVVNVGLATLGIDSNWQLLSYGAVILLAILIDRINSRRTA